MKIVNEINDIKKSYKNINIDLVFNQKDNSDEIKIFENMCDIELPKALKELYKISDGFSEAICSFKYQGHNVGVRFESFKECKSNFNFSDPEYLYLSDFSSPVWRKLPQVEKTLKTKFKYKFASDDMGLGGKFFIDYKPSKHGKVGQILFMTSQEFIYVCDNFDEFLDNGISEFKANFEKINGNQIYRIKMKNVLVTDDVEEFKNIYRSDIGLGLFLENSGNIITSAHKLNSKKIMAYIFDEFKYSLENYLLDAIRMQNLSLCEKIISSKINVNKITDEGRRHSLLKDVSNFNNDLAIAMAKKIIDMGADINYVGLGKLTILDELYLSAAQGHGGELMIELFEKYGAKSSDVFYKNLFYELKKK